ncbi:MAG: lasso peptide biosynthesis B2 protein [Actinomycetota bacterium]|nr:lasso peptide biosynthesis B2 protein [Actinomycetota bacterium]
MRRRPDLPTLRAALWALLALRRTRRALKRDRVTDVRVPQPPALPPSAGRGVRAVIRRWDPTCLERALVLQAWNVAHGQSRDVVIGVNGAGDEFAAHAWLDGEPDEHGPYHELMRVSAP